jgi:hypothetical protein
MGVKKTPRNRPLGSFLAPLAPTPRRPTALPAKGAAGHGSPVVAPVANARCKLQHKAQAFLKIEPLVAYPKLEAAQNSGSNSQKPLLRQRSLRQQLGATGSRLTRQ